MSLLVASINVNGLRDTKKRNYSFLWLIEQKYDCVCLQETIVLIRQLKMKNYHTVGADFPIRFRNCFDKFFLNFISSWFENTIKKK
jgi:exonuclease III